MGLMKYIFLCLIFIWIYPSIYKLCLSIYILIYIDIYYCLSTLKDNESNYNLTLSPKGCKVYKGTDNDYLYCQLDRFIVHELIDILTNVVIIHIIIYINICIIYTL